MKYCFKFGFEDPALDFPAVLIKKSYTGPLNLEMWSVNLKALLRDS